MKKEFIFIFLVLFLVGFVNAEDNETNSTEFPDLIITEINLFDQDTNENVNLNVSVGISGGHHIVPTIKNIGGVAVNINGMRFSSIYDREDDEINFLATCGNVSLEINEEIVCEYEASYQGLANPGFHNLTLFLDYDEIIEESDETNNEFTISVFAYNNTLEIPDGNETEDNDEVNETEELEDINETDDDGNETENEEVRKIKQSRNKLRINWADEAGIVEIPEECDLHGVVLKCNLENGGREMFIFAGNSKKLIVQSKGVNMTTKVELYTHEGNLFGVFEGNMTKEIVYLPDEIKLKIEERVIHKIDKEFKIELEENGEYEVRYKKHAKLFKIIDVKKTIKSKVDIETGQTIKESSSWWGFLAKDIMK